MNADLSALNLLFIQIDGLHVSTDLVLLPSEVADVICQHSPGAVTKARHDDLRALVEKLAPQLQAKYAKV